MWSSLQTSTNSHLNNKTKKIKNKHLLASCEHGGLVINELYPGAFIQNCLLLSVGIVNPF